DGARSPLLGTRAGSTVSPRPDPHPAAPAETSRRRHGPNAGLGPATPRPSHHAPAASCGVRNACSWHSSNRGDVVRRVGRGPESDYDESSLAEVVDSIDAPIPRAALSPYARGMTSPDTSAAIRGDGSPAGLIRRRVATVCAVTASLLLGLAVGGALTGSTGRAVLPGWLAAFGVALGI